MAELPLEQEGTSLGEPVAFQLGSNGRGYVVAVAADRLRDRQSAFLTIDPSTGGSHARSAAASRRSGAASRRSRRWGACPTTSVRRRSASGSRSACPRAPCSGAGVPLQRALERGRADHRVAARGGQVGRLRVRDARHAGRLQSHELRGLRPRPRSRAQRGRRARAVSSSASATSRTTDAGWSGRCGSSADACSGPCRRAPALPPHGPPPRHHRPRCLDAAPVRPFGDLARLARGLRDRPPLPPAAAALRAPQRQPPLGAGQDPRRPHGLDPLPEPVPMIGLGAKADDQALDRRLPRGRRRRVRSHPRAPSRGARALRAQDPRPQLRARRGRRPGGDAAREPRAAPRRAAHRAAPVAVPADAQHVARRAGARSYGLASTSTTPRTGASCARPTSTEPEAVVERRAKVRGVLGDIAKLPEQQRHALIRREIDGITHAELAERARRRRRRRRRTSCTARARTSSSSARRARTTATASAPTCSTRTTRAAAPRPPATATSRRAASAAPSAARCSDTRKAAAILMPVPLMIVAFGLITGKAAAATREGRDGRVGRDRRGGRGDHRRCGRRRRPGLPARRSGAAGGQQPRAPEGSLAKGGALPKATAIVRRTVPLAGGGSSRRPSLPGRDARRRPDRGRAARARATRPARSSAPAPARAWWWNRGRPGAPRARW